jgi:hypothetical protein
MSSLITISPLLSNLETSADLVAVTTLYEHLQIASIDATEGDVLSFAESTVYLGVITRQSDSDTNSRRNDEELEVGRYALLIDPLL